MSESAATKPEGYYSRARADIVELLPRPLGAVLDVGCGSGFVGRELRANGAGRLEGIEMVSDVAADASRYYDAVHVGDIPTVLPGITGPFDTICCFDVLEHLADPYSVLAALLRLARPGGTLAVSAPNARHWSLMRDLLVRGTFGYAPQGHRDHTHLRWFTPSDLVAAIRSSGWEPVRESHSSLGRSAPLNRLARGRLVTFAAVQWYVVATAPRA